MNGSTEVTTSHIKVNNKIEVKNNQSLATQHTTNRMADKKD